MKLKIKEFLKKDGFKWQMIKTQNNKISLEELAKKQYPILFDTSIIIQCLNDNIRLNTIKERIDAAKKDKNFYSLMRNYLKKGCNFYISFGVNNELQGGKGYPPKKIKKISNKFPRHKKILELLRERKKERNEKNKLANDFLNYDKIFQLNDREQNLYQYLYNKYLDFKKEFNLSETDFDILVLAISKSKKSCPVALVSNDYGIQRASKEILKKEYLYYKFEFFIRRNFLEFEKVLEF